MQLYKNQVIEAIKRQYGEEVRKLFAAQHFDRERQSVDNKSFGSQHLNIDGNSYVYPEHIVLTQDEIERIILPNLHIDTYDIR